MLLTPRGAARRHPLRSMAFKGEPGDAFVLATADKTYAVQLVETSNSVLVGDAGVDAGRAMVLRGIVGSVVQVRVRQAGRSELAMRAAADGACLCFKW